jgi:hypothetical protein
MPRVSSFVPKGTWYGDRSQPARHFETSRLTSPRRIVKVGQGAAALRRSNTISAARLEGAMKRDIDLVRQLLFAIENHPSGFAPTELKIEGFTEEQIGYHLSLMLEAKLINGSDVTHMGSESPEAIATSLTWKGHEFAEAARNDTIWNQAKATIKEKGGSVTFAVLSQLLQNLCRSALGL